MFLLRLANSYNEYLDIHKMHKNTAGQIFLIGGTNFGSLQRDRSAKLFELCFQSF